MIVVDFSQICLANLLVDPASATEEDLVRHKVLNSLRLINSKFRNKYGSMVIACDDTNVWRKKMFPYYKANRKKSQEKSSLDWNEIFHALGQIRDEVRDNLPYKFVKVNRAEADDVIATLAKHYHQEGPFLVVSGDKDFRQLLAYPNVEQYSPRDKKMLRVEDARVFLAEHIIRGDDGDGVPNIFSDDDVFVNPAKRQKQVTKKRLEELMPLLTKGRLPDDETIKRNFKRNNDLINLLDRVPEDLETEILEQYKQFKPAARSGLINYFIAKKLRKLTTNLTDF